MRLQNTSARPKEKCKLEFERHGRHGVNVEDDNDFIHPPNHQCSPDVCGAGIIFIAETVNRQG